MFLQQNCPANLSYEAWVECFHAAHPWIIWVKLAALVLSFIVPAVLLWLRPPDALRPSTVIFPAIAWAYLFFLFIEK